MGGGGGREGGTPAWVEAQNDAVCALMIEKRQAVEDLEQLLSVPGVDMVQFGATDCPPPSTTLLPIPLPRRSLLTTALTAAPRPQTRCPSASPVRTGGPALPSTRR